MSACHIALLRALAHVRSDTACESLLAQSMYVPTDFARKSRTLSLSPKATPAQKARQAEWDALGKKLGLDLEQCPHLRAEGELAHPN